MSVDLFFADNAWETTTTTGAGTLTLAGAKTGSQAVPAAADGLFVPYRITSGSAWETGYGLYTHSGPTLTRSLVESSTGSLLSLTGTSDVYVSLPAKLFPRVLPSTMGHRLTLQSGVPVPTTDQIAKTTVYMTQFNGPFVALFDGHVWRLYYAPELSLAIGTKTSGVNYDVFCYDVSGLATLCFGPAWSSDISRGTGAGTTEVTYQDGVLVNANAISGGPAAKCGRLIGAIRTTSTTTTEQSIGGSTTQVGGKQFVANINNRVPRPLSVIDTTDFWLYGTNTVRQANGASGNKVEYVVAVDGDPVFAQALGVCYLGNDTGTAAKVGPGVDSTTSLSGVIQGGVNEANASSIYAPISGSYRGYPGLGYHYVSWNEKGASAGTCAFLGDNGADGQQTGLLAEVLG